MGERIKLEELVADASAPKKKDRGKLRDYLPEITLRRAGFFIMLLGAFLSFADIRSLWNNSNFVAEQTSKLSDRTYYSDENETANFSQEVRKQEINLGYTEYAAISGIVVAGIGYALARYKPYEKVNLKGKEFGPSFSVHRGRKR